MTFCIAIRVVDGVVALAATHSWWTRQLATAVRTLPSDWADVLWHSTSDTIETTST
ncbi:MAG: hypothetical protein OEZ14_08645 [Acidimicrobiia bacterium]|nr:hypothetical protein [Acidimicrobiia bacterium]MDH5520587.1 hypothetical protein [Acidimicrobiia bacterium]